MTKYESHYAKFVYFLYLKEHICSQIQMYKHICKHISVKIVKAVLASPITELMEYDQIEQTVKS